MPNKDVKQKVFELLARMAPDEEPRVLTHFTYHERTRASGLAAELSEVAAESSVENAVNQAFEHVKTMSESLSFVKHAFELFIAHDPEAARRLALPSREPRNSESPTPANVAGPDGA